MNSEQFESFMHSQRELYKLYREQLQLSKQLLIIQQKIESKLDKLISDRPLKDPDYQKALGDYQKFNWSSIDAKVLATDSDGVSSVEWNGKIYKRRSPENKFAPAIWFSRKDGDTYQKLITFKSVEPAEPISRKVLTQLNN